MQNLGGGTRAYAVNGDGSVVVGETTFSARAFMWTQANGMQILPSLGGTGGSGAYATNSSGNVIVGMSGQFFRPTMWINGSPIELLTSIPDSSLSPFGVSDSGDVVVGNLNGLGGVQHKTAVWTAASGTTVPLAQYLTANGVALPAGITLGTALAISSDGRTFAGYTENGPYGVQGWVATIPSPSAAALLGLAGLMAARRRRRI